MRTDWRMDEESTAQHIDLVLVPFLRAEDENEAERLLAALITEQAEPLISEIIGYKLRTLFHRESLDHQESEDVRSNALLSLIARLREIKLDSAPKAIASFRSYVAVTAYNACNEHLRQKYPQRHSLKNQLRYLFSHHPQLALWEDSRKETVCGYQNWRGANKNRAGRDRISQLLEERRSFSSQSLVEIVIDVLDFLDAPVELDEMVGIIAERTGVRDQIAQAVEDEKQIIDPRQAIDKTVEQRLFLSQLWDEICLLPLRQRIALLLNLRDEQGNNQLAMFPLTGIASSRQIAAALEMTDEEFARLWNELPLEDRAIAERLSLTRQQVINLRKAARERLARRTNIKTQI